MSHKTMVNGTAYEISGGKAMVDGTVYDIQRGLTMVDYSVHEIGFASGLRVIISGTGSSGELYALIGSKKYYGDEELSFDSLDSIYFYARPSTSNGKSYIILNGSIVKNGTRTSPASYTLDIADNVSRITIEFITTTSINEQKTIRITTE